MPNMIWKEIQKEAPENAQEVLLNFEGRFYVVNYVAARNSFVLRGGREIKMSEGKMFWSELVDANEI